MMTTLPPSRPPPPNGDVRAAIQAYDLVRFVQADGVPLVRSNAAYWTAHCPLPGHEDSTPSFRVYADPARGWCCYGCRRSGSAVDYVAARLGWDARQHFRDILGVLGLVPGPRRTLPPLPPAKRTPPAPEPWPDWAPAAIYDYQDASGDLVYQVLRWQDPDHPDKKTFRQRRPTGPDQWARNLAGVTPVPYRLPDLLAAALDTPVLVCEGEKVVEAARAAGQVATCNSGGAGQWTPGLAPWLAGRTVVCLPDNDAVGRAHMQEVVDSLRPYAARVLTLPLPDVPPDGGDLADYLATHDAGDLYTLVAEALLGPEEVAPVPVDPPGVLDVSKAERDLLTAATYWATTYGEDWGYDPGGGHWYHWAGTHWQPLAAHHPLLDAQAGRVLRALGLSVTSASRVDSVVRLSRHLCLRPLAAPPGLVNFQNGTLDTRGPTPVLRPPDRADQLTYCLPYAYRPGGHPTVTRFLEETIPDATARMALLVHLGLALLGDTSLHYAVLLLGPRRSGKTTLLQLGNLLCGQAPMGFAGAELFDRASEGLRSRSTWNTRRLVAIDELPVEALRNEELVKMMAAHSGVPMRALHQPEETENQWRPKLLMNTNEAPRYTDRSGALTERLIPIRCPHTRPPDARNKALVGSFLGELPALAATCITAALPLLADPYATYPVSPLMQQDLAEIEQDGDTLKSFVSEACILDPTAWVPSADLYKEYRYYCSDNGNQPMSQKKLTGSLVSRWRITTDRRRDTPAGPVLRGLTGIRLRTADDPELAEEGAPPLL